MKKNKLTQNEKKVLKMWGIALLSIIIILFVVNLFLPVKSLFSSLFDISHDTTTYGEVNDYSRYATVTTAIDKYYAFINQKDYDAVVKILNASYVKKNNITEDNVEDFITTSDKQLSFDANIMYLVSGKDGVYKYYVDGTIVYTNSGKEIEKAYYSVILDANNDENLKLFSVEPITEKEYNKGANK